MLKTLNDRIRVVIHVDRRNMSSILKDLMEKGFVEKDQMSKLGIVIGTIPSWIKTDDFTKIQGVWSVNKTF